MEKKITQTILDIDTADTVLPLKEIETTKNNTEAKVKKVKAIHIDEEPTINCLRNERIVIRYVPKLGGIWGTNPKHILAGGMAEGSVRTFVVPRLTSGMYVNILTDSEKSFLENIMGLEYNALSIYKKIDNFWDDSNENGINKVRLTKQDNYLNLADPEDYIKYKILLANKDFIASSLKVLQDSPKVTYQFVIISEGEETKVAKANMSKTMQCYKEFGKIEDDVDILRTIIEIIDGRPTAPTAKLEFLQTKINDLIQIDSKLFLKIVTDPLLKTKVLIKKSIEAGLISKRGNYLYRRSDNTPLCNNGEEPTTTNAAKYINDVKNQEFKFTLEASLKNK